MLAVGVFMCSFGLYEKVVDSILHFFRNVKENLKFLLPIAIGTFIGIFMFGNVLKLVFNKFYVPTCFAFIGLILGSLKLIIKQADFKKINIFHFICLLITFSIGIYFVVLEKNINFTLYNNTASYLIFAGMLMSAGIVIPGISKTVILMMLGIYQMYLSAISSFDLSFLIPVGIGLLIGGLLFLIIINFLFKFVKSYTYFGIIGFILASIFILYPGFTFNIQGIISILILISTFILGFKLSDLDKKNKSVQHF